jgi:hypothetical protein
VHHIFGGETCELVRKVGGPADCKGGCGGRLQDMVTLGVLHSFSCWACLARKELGTGLGLSASREACAKQHTVHNRQIINSLAGKGVG